MKKIKKITKQMKKKTKKKTKKIITKDNLRTYQLKEVV